MKQRPEWDLIQQAQIRLFFTSCRMRKSTADATIKIGSDNQVSQKPKPLPRRRGKRRLRDP